MSKTSPRPLVFRRHPSIRRRSQDSSGATIGEAVLRLRSLGFEISASQIRKLEREGLLHIPDRTDGNYRVLDEVTIARVRMILGFRSLGLSLHTIRKVIAFLDRERPGEKRSLVQQLVLDLQRRADQKIDHLRDLKSLLSTYGG